MSDAITATEEQTAADLADLKSDQAMTNAALRLLEGKSPTAYSRALAALREDTREWWEEQLTWEADDYDEDENPYCADAASLKRFLERKILPWHEKELREVNNRPLIRTQAFGQAVDVRRLERLSRYEVQLDRKLERALSTLLRVQQLRADDSPRYPFRQNLRCDCDRDAASSGGPEDAYAAPIPSFLSHTTTC